MLPVPRNKRLKEARESMLPVNCQNEMPATSLTSLNLEGIVSFQSIHSISTSTKNVERKSVYETETRTGDILAARKVVAIRVGCGFNTDCPASSNKHTIGFCVT
jgi:hypothetical protein